MSRITASRVEEVMEIMMEGISIPKEEIEAKTEVMKESLEKLILLEYVIDWIDYSVECIENKRDIRNREDLDRFFRVLTVFIYLLKEAKIEYISIQYLLDQISLDTIYETYELNNIEVSKDYKIFLRILLKEINPKEYKKFLIEYLTTLKETTETLGLDFFRIFESMEEVLIKEGELK